MVPCVTWEYLVNPPFSCLGSHVSRWESKWRMVISLSQMECRARRAGRAVIDDNVCQFRFLQSSYHSTAFNEKGDLN